MQVVTEELCAAVSSVAIKDCEEARLLDTRRQRLVRLGAGLLQVEHDRYTILVVVARRSVVCVRCVRQDQALSSVGDLGRLHFRNDLTERTNTVVTDSRSRDAQVVVAVERDLRLVDVARLDQAGRILLEQLLYYLQALETYEWLHTGHGAHIARRL